MAAEVDKATQHAGGPNGIAPAAPNGLGEKTLVESSTAEKAATEPAPAEATGPETAAAEPVVAPAPTPAVDEPKPADAVPSDPAVVPPAAAAEESKVADDGPKPVENAAPAQTETSTEAPPASAPVEAPAEPAPVVEKPLETGAAQSQAAAPEVVSGASQPNGTATNGTTTISKEQEDVEMKDAPTAVSAADIALAATEPASDPVGVDHPAKEPEQAAVAGEKRKATDEEPAVEDTLAEPKKPKLDETTAQAEATQPSTDPVLPTETTSASVSSTTETPLDGVSAPKKAGRPKKTQKEKVPVSPVGRTLRKTRSQGPVEV